MIPAGAEKPDDLRRSIRPPRYDLPGELKRVLTIMQPSVPHNRLDAAIDAARDERIRLIYMGAFAYARGDFAQTIRCFRQNEGDSAAMLCASPLAIAAAISMGDYPLYTEIERYLQNVVQTTDSGEVAAYAQLALAGGYLGAMAPDMIPDWLKEGNFSGLPPQAKPDAAYNRAKYFQCKGQYESMLAVAETALGFCHTEYEISFPDTYLTLMCAHACYALDRPDDAWRWLAVAMRTNLPNGFITPFAELIPLFGGMIERLLEKEYPHCRGAVIELWKRTFTNWLTFHNQLTKDNITLILSLRDYEMALLAAKGVPRAKIAAQFNISVGRLNNIMKNIYQRLYISGRDELSKFIL